MLSIQFNNQKISIDENLSLAKILANQGFVDSHFAIAINQNFIPRSHYDDTYLNEGDVIELVAPMQGG